MAAEGHNRRKHLDAARALLACALLVSVAQAQTPASPAAPTAPASSPFGATLAPAAALQPWPEVGRQGVVRLVVVPLEHMRDRAAYDRQIAHLCAAEGRCFVNFYSNSTGAALAMPLPDAVFQEPTVVFRRTEKRGAEQFRWACRLGLEPGSCF